MLELVFLSVLSSIFGILTRAAFENENSRFILYHSLFIGFLVGVYTFFNYTIFNLPMTLEKYFGVFFFFWMVGYVLSDVIESITFIATHPCRIRRKR